MRQILTTFVLLCTLTVSAQDVVIRRQKKQQTTTSGKTKSSQTPSKTLSKQTTGYINGHEWVDLGLPSGTLWATCNVGASMPQDFGTLYSLVFNSSSLIRTSHDIAYTQWGNRWCLPTEKQFKELKSYCNCSWKSCNGISGYTLKGPNGNTLFFPAAGWTMGEDPIKQKGEYGSYWAGDMPSSATPEYRYFLSFDKAGINIEYGFCNAKQSIRAVVCK